MNSLLIEKGVPLPYNPNPKRAERHRNLLRDWHLLEVGDSALVETRAQAQGAIGWAHAHGRFFISRVERKKPYRIRVWRIA